MKKVLISSIIILLASSSFANEWTRLSVDKYIDVESISIDNSQCLDKHSCYSVWVKVNVSEEDNPVGYYKSLHQFDCLDKTARLKRLIPYDKIGNQMGDYPSYDSDWHRTKPKTDETFLLNYVCSYDMMKLDENGKSTTLLKPTSIYETNVNSMVYINTQDAQGSGVIVDTDGTFLTCFHVIANANYIKIRTNKGKEYSVTGFKYINPLDDIAILTINANETFVPITINHKPINIGEKVYTISSPQGRQFTFSDGILSQKSLEQLQFTAPISPGSSGGALLNQDGYLIGIITSQYKDSQNINFALPNNYYEDKLKNPEIKNIFGQNWVDFVASNASEDQFKLYTEYAINDGNYGLLYKYLMPLTSKHEFPANMYALVGTFALIYATKEDDNLAKDDAILLYQKSISNNINLEASYSGLVMAYLLKDDSEQVFSSLAQIKISYPNSYNRFMQMIEAVIANNNEDYCRQKFSEFYAYILTKIN